MKVQHLIAVLALTLGASAFAQAPLAPRDPLATPNIDQRQINQEKRIQQGVAAGALTHREAARVERRQGRIQLQKVAARADGRVTSAERHKLNRQQKRARSAYKHRRHHRR